MPKTTLSISSRNYSSWSLRGWLLVRFAGLDLKTAVGLATTQPAALFGKPQLAELRDGAAADLIVFDLPDDLRKPGTPRQQAGLQIRQTIIAGREISAAN